MNKNKYFAITVILLLIGFYLYNENCVFSGYYLPSGKLESRFYKIPGKLLCGYKYYESGAIKLSYCNKMGAGIIGKLKKYYESGELFSIVNYRNYKRQGIERVYSRNGKLIQLLPFVNGKVQGWSYKYDSNGRKIEEAFYFQDSLYYFKIHDKTNSCKDNDQPIPTFFFERDNYWFNDTIKILIVFKSDSLFPYDREDLILSYDLNKVESNDKELPYPRFNINLTHFMH